MEKAEGRIAGIRQIKTKTNKDMYFLDLDRGEDNKDFSCFGKCPDEIHQLKNSREMVVVEYEVSGDFKNLKSVVKKGGLDDASKQVHESIQQRKEEKSGRAREKPGVQERMDAKVDQMEAEYKRASNIEGGPVAKVLKLRNGVSFPIKTGQLEDLKTEWVKDCLRDHDRIDSLNISESNKTVLLEKVISPFQYWLENQFTILMLENTNENGTLKPRSEWVGVP